MTSRMDGFPEHTLLVGAKKARLTRMDVIEATRDTQSVVWIGDGRLCLTAFILKDDGRPEAGFTFVMQNYSGTEGLTDLNRPATVHRLFDLIERFDELNPQIVTAAMAVATENGVSERFDDLLKPINKYVSADDLRALLAGPLPSGFVDFCVAAATHGCLLDLDSITDEVEAGRLEYDARLHQLKVETVGDRRLRYEGRAGFLEGFRPAIEAFLQSPYRMAQLCMKEFLEHMLLQVRARGLAEQPSHAFALAIVMAGDAIKGMMDKAGPDPFPYDRLIAGVTSDDIFKQFSRDAANFASGYYKQETPQMVARTVADSWRNWELIPCDTSLL